MAMCPTQLSLPSPRPRGGPRRGAGRKRTPGRRPSVPHRARAPHKAAHPLHVTLRASDAARCLRADRVFPAVRRAITAASREGFRQDHHLHLLVEAEDRVRLSRGIAGLAIRIARAVNRALGRRGAVWSGRYHARAITTPRAVRHAIVYILFNRRSSPGALAETVLPDLLLQRPHRDAEPPRGLGAVLPVAAELLDDQQLLDPSHAIAELPVVA